jgi:peptide/nickel transport system permease protein
MKRFAFLQVLHRPYGAAALGLLLLLYGCAALAPFLSPYRPSDQNLDGSFHRPTALLWKDGSLRVRLYHLADPLSSTYEPTGESKPILFFQKGFSYKLLGFIPCERHLFQVDNPHRIYLLGSDSTGRDVFSRLLHGSQISLTVGLIGITITMVLGFLVGASSGYFGGKVDFLLMRSVEILMAVPGLYLLLALRSALAPYFESKDMYLVIVIILSLLGWAGTARIIRGLTLSLRNRAFVLAAEAIGESPLRILWRHILPNISSYLLVAATLSIPGYILGEAALSFLGLGIQEPSASWGLMLKQSQDMRVFMLNFWWLLTPGAAIVITVVAFNILGDTLRDLVDPKFRLNK